MSVQIPLDVYTSPREVVIIMPLGGVQKKSLEIFFERDNDHTLMISGKRVQPKLKADFSPLQEQCYRGDFRVPLQLPPDIYVDRIHSTITPENILQIVIPKMLVPEKMKVDVSY